MNWTKEIPKEPGYYFIKKGGEDCMVEVIMTRDGPKYLDFLTLEIRDCEIWESYEWLGPIKSKDIINLWGNFGEKKYIVKYNCWNSDSYEVVSIRNPYKDPMIFVPEADEIYEYSEELAKKYGLE